jgi:uncharacterized protein YPO0396
MSTIQEDLFDRTSLDTLAGVGHDPASTQWKLESLQVVNWGGFQGHHKLPFHHEATMISGGSGTGKSTLLDAYTALMMPSRVPFNGASNDSGTGRARNEAGGQRTLLTYLRGKQGTNDETGGASSENLLRGGGRATWGAVAATFTDTSGHAMTALRVYFVPATATDSNEIVTRMATIPEAVSLADLREPMRVYIAGKPLSTVISTTWSSARVYKKYTEFSNVLFTKLAIGANGDGLNALDLLARIQAGRPVNSVNALYRELVLDTPATFKDADLALADFDTLSDDLARMEDAERKHTTLRDLPAVHEQLTTAKDRIRDLDQFGVTRPGFTKLTAWTLRRECDLLDAAADHAHAEHRAAQAAARSASEQTEQLWEDLESARDDSGTVAATSCQASPRSWRIFTGGWRTRRAVETSSSRSQVPSPRPSPARPTSRPSSRTPGRSRVASTRGTSATRSDVTRRAMRSGRSRSAAARSTTTCASSPSPAPTSVDLSPTCARSSRTTSGCAPRTCPTSPSSSTSAPGRRSGAPPSRPSWAAKLARSSSRPNDVARSRAP